MGKGLLIKAEKLKEKICTKTYIFKIHVQYITLSAVSLAYHEMASQYDTCNVRKCIAIHYNSISVNRCSSTESGHRFKWLIFINKGP